MATILVVDDNTAVARMLARFLETKGHRTVVAHSGPDALEVARRHPPPDLILLDLSMPGMDGMEVLRRLTSDETYPRPSHADSLPLHPAATTAFTNSAEPPTTGPAVNPGAPPVIFFSAVDDPAVIASALKHGARDYWIKASFKFDELPKALERYLPQAKREESSNPSQ